MKNYKKVLNDLFDYDLKIYQYQGLFKFSLDSILLAEFINITKNTKSILDLCCGNGAIPLILSTKTSSHIDAIEIQRDIYDIAIESVNYNNLLSQITIYNEDVKNIDNFLKNRKYDIITCNPPYFKVDNNPNINESESLAIARHELKITLEKIFEIASMHLNTKGEFYLVHRASRLDEIIILANKYKLNVKNIELIKTTANSKPYIVLVRCIKDSGFGIKINNIKNIEGLSTYKNIFKEEK